MLALPPELLTLFTSSFFAGIMKAWSRNIDARREAHHIALQAMQIKNEHAKEARLIENPCLQWTRRVIALISVFSIIVIPKIVAIFYPDIAIHVAHSELSEGFLFFSSATEKLRWVALKGLVITPLDTHILSAIIGLYFGGSIMENR
jgi:hypothetical protein